MTYVTWLYPGMSRVICHPLIGPWTWPRNNRFRMPVSFLLVQIYLHHITTPKFLNSSTPKKCFLVLLWNVCIRSENSGRYKIVDKNRFHKFLSWGFTRLFLRATRRAVYGEVQPRMNYTLPTGNRVLRMRSECRSTQARSSLWTPDFELCNMLHRKFSHHELVRRLLGLIVLTQKTLQHNFQLRKRKVDFWTRVMFLAMSAAIDPAFPMAPANHYCSTFLIAYSYHGSC